MKNQTLHRSSKWAYVVLGIALVTVGCLHPDTTPPPPPDLGNDCIEPEVVLLEEGWQFRTDPEDVGVPQRWYASSLDDTDWRALAPGEPWEFSGVEYDGAAWYRTTFTMPSWSTVYLGLGRVDDAATLWLDGEKLLSWEAENPRAQALDVTGSAEPGERLTLAVRVEDYGGYGGIKGASRLSNRPQAVMEDTDYISLLFDSHPQWPEPGWVDGAPVAWTMSGAEGAREKALVRSDGAVAPWADAPTVEVWLYDSDSQQLLTGTERSTTFSLHRGHLPMPRWEWEAAGTQVQNLLFRDLQQDAVRWQIEVHNPGETARNLTLLLVVRPFGIARSFTPICSLALQGSSRLWINEMPFLVAGTEPAHTGIASMDESMLSVTEGRAPTGDVTYEDPAGLGAAVLSYPISLNATESHTYQFAFPTTPETDPAHRSFPAVDQRVELRRSATADSWEQVLDRVEIEVPDELLVDAVRASAAYLLIAIDPEGPHPGPLDHSAVWVRDAAYTGLALMQLGYADVV
ncbi:MAG: hypothetical protein ACOC8C_00275, partial [Chloroflexota bacterium]